MQILQARHKLAEVNGIDSNVLAVYSIHVFYIFGNEAGVKVQSINASAPSKSKSFEHTGHCLLALRSAHARTHCRWKA
jgi:hypothetical protein